MVLVAGRTQRMWAGAGGGREEGARVPTRAARQSGTRGWPALASAAPRIASMASPALVLAPPWAQASCHQRLPGGQPDAHTTAALRALVSGRARAILYMASECRPRKKKEAGYGCGSVGYDGEQARCARFNVAAQSCSLASALAFPASSKINLGRERCEDDETFSVAGNSRGKWQRGTTTVMSSQTD